MKRFEIDYKMAFNHEENTAFIQAKEENEAINKLADQINNPLFYVMEIRENKDGTLK